MTAPVFTIDGESFQRDPAPVLKEMLAAGDVVYVKLPVFGKMPAATSYQTVNRILCDTAMFARDGRVVGKKGTAGLQWWMPKIIHTFANNMMAYDGDDHRRLRSLVDQAFLKRNVDAMRDDIRLLADRMLTDLKRENRGSSSIELLSGFCRQFPLAVICEVLGLPDEDRPKFTKWFSPIGNATNILNLMKIVPGMFRLRNYLTSEFQHVRSNPMPGLVTELVHAEFENERFSRDELLSMVFLLLVAGHETTVHLISDGVVALLDHPDQLERLRTDPDLYRTAIDEILRFTSPVQMTKPRYVTQDTEVGGVELSRGEMILGMLACANYDSNQFPDPETFDVGRTPNRHLTFGAGIHVCLGMKLAKLEAEIALDQIWNHFPDLALAIPREELKWKGRIGLRTLESLPIAN